MEQWSGGVMGFRIPILQHSSTPLGSFRKGGCFHFTILYSQFTILLAVLAAIKPDFNLPAGKTPVGL
jgi:hypothetical protein